MPGYAYIAFDLKLQPFGHADGGACLGGQSSTIRDYGIGKPAGQQTELVQGIGLKSAGAAMGQIPAKQQEDIGKIKKASGYNEKQARLAVLCKFGQASFDAVAVFSHLDDATLKRILDTQATLIKEKRPWGIFNTCANVAEDTVNANGYGPGVPYDAIPMNLFNDCVYQTYRLQIEWITLTATGEHWLYMARAEAERRLRQGKDDNLPGGQPARTETQIKRDEWNYRNPNTSGARRPQE